MLDLNTTLKVARLNNQYPPVPYTDVIHVDVNRNGDEFVGEGNVVSPEQKLIYHFNNDPRWKQVFDQFFKVIHDEHPPGSG